MRHSSGILTFASILRLAVFEGVAYIGLLLRITNETVAGTENIIYPFEQGVDNITKVEWQKICMGSLPDRF